MIKSRVLKGLMANGFGQGVTILAQLVTVPIFLTYWGIELYGEWLILTAIPAYFAMADIGFASVATNEMTMLVARNERNRALVTFQSTLAVIGIASFFVLVAVAVMDFLHGGSMSLPVHLISVDDVRLILPLLAIQIIVGFLGGMAMAGFRCEGGYAIGTIYMNMIRLLEFISTVLVIMIGDVGPFWVVVAALSVRIVGTTLLFIEMKRKVPWLKLGLAHLRTAEVRRLFRPAFAFMAFPLGNALSLQGVIMVIAAILGAQAVAVFSTLRTLSRLLLQVMGMINAAIWPEFSIAYGAGDIALSRRIHRKSVQWSVWFVMVGALTLFFTGGEIVQVWTHGKIIFDTTLFGLLLLVVIANSTWYTSSVVLVAINKHEGMALVYLIGTIIGLFLSIVLCRMIGLNGVAISLLAIDIGMMFFVVRNSVLILNDDLRGFVSHVLRFPKVTLNFRN